MLRNMSEGANVKVVDIETASAKRAAGKQRIHVIMMMSTAVALFCLLCQAAFHFDNSKEKSKKCYINIIAAARTCLCVFFYLQKLINNEVVKSIRQSTDTNSKFH